MDFLDLNGFCEVKNMIPAVIGIGGVDEDGFALLGSRWGPGASSAGPVGVFPGSSNPRALVWFWGLTIWNCLVVSLGKSLS